MTYLLYLERAMGIEPTALCLGSRCSTTELRPLPGGVSIVGIRPRGCQRRDLPHPNGYRKESVASKVGLPKGGDVTRLTLYEYAATVRPRYGRARKREKGRILDEFCQTTGMHRKAATRLLGGGRRLAAVAKKKGRPSLYGPEVTEALVKVWEAGDRMCGKLLAAVLPALVGGLERHGELRLDASVRGALISMSAATIDRRLQGWRKRLGRQPRRQSASGGSLKAEIPVRTWSEWQGVRAGPVQA